MASLEGFVMERSETGSRVANATGLEREVVVELARSHNNSSLTKPLRYRNHYAIDASGRQSMQAMAAIFATLGIVRDHVSCLAGR